MKNKIISTELEVLFEGLKNVYRLKIVNKNKANYLNLDWHRLSYMADFHNFKSILFQLFLNRNQVSPINQSLHNYCREIAVNNLFSSSEFVNISKLLDGKKIDYLPYKGHLFLKILFGGRQLRAIGDLDILVMPRNAKKALEIIINDGYNFHDLKAENNLTNTEIIEIVPNTFGMNETTMVKKVNGKNHFIDFHWGFHYSFLPYQIDLEILFENKSTVIVNGVDCVAPSNYANFIMLTIHHGGRECYTSLKYIADLMGFMENLAEKIDWKEMLVELEKMKLKRPALVGFFLLQENFDYELPEIIKSQFSPNKINTKLTEPIIDYWENCYDILSLKGRLKYERILWSIQDEGFSLWKYFYEMYKMYSYPNPIESPRLITFPNNWHFLNFMSKLVTYVYKRGFGKVIR